MAFSGRARRAGAFSASQALTDAPFAGEWVDEGGDIVTIKDCKIFGADGSVMALTLKSKTEVSFEMDSEVFHGTLVDPGKIKWSDGGEWTRKGEKKADVESTDRAEEERKRRAEVERKEAEEAARRKAEEEQQQAALEAKRKAQELARKKAAEEEQARRATALEKAKLARAEAAERERAAAAEVAKAAAAQAAQQAGDSEPAAQGSNLDEAKAKSEAGIDKARQAFEAEKARKAAVLERAKAAKPAEEASAAADSAKARSDAGLDKARQAFEAEKARKAAALERARAAKAEQEAAAKAKADPAGSPAGSTEETEEAPDDSAKAKSEAGIDKARSAFEAEKARKAAALEKARAAKAAEAAAQAADPKVAEAKAKSEAGLNKARAAFEAEKSRKAAALEKARAAKLAEQEASAQGKDAAAPGKDAAVPGKDAAPQSKAPAVNEEARAKSNAGLEKARSAFEAEKARKAAALERVRAAKLAEQEAAEQGKAEPDQEEQKKKSAQEEAKAKSAAGLEKARSAFEAEKARKAAALEKARAAKAAAEAAAAAGGDDDDEPPALTPAAAGGKRGSAFSAAASRAGEAAAAAPAASKRGSAFSAAMGQTEAQTSDWSGPAKSKTSSAFSTMAAGAPESLQPTEPGAEEPELLPLNEADFEPGIVVKLTGLKTKPELNGQWGVLVEFNETKKRWSVRVDGMEDMMLKGDNLVAVSQEEYDAWMADQAKAEASAKREVEALLKSKVSGGKTLWTEAESGPLIRKPGDEGNQFDICMAVEPDGQRAARKIVDKMKERGVCLVEANAPPDLLCAAYEEAEKLWKAGAFAAPMQDFGASELEMTMWNYALFQDEKKAKWIGEDAGDSMQALRILSGNIQEFAKGLTDLVGPKLNIQWNNLWDAMLVCYTGDKSYSYHLDNPCLSDGQGLPDNGIRMTLAYFINPHWSPEEGYNGGGLDVYVSSPSEPPSSLGKARKGNRMRIAPHADTLVCFPSQRVPHQVISTKGKELWFCMWMWCFDEEVMLNFPMMVQQQWQQEEAGGQVAVRPGGSKVEEDEEDEVLSD